MILKHSINHHENHSLIIEMTDAEYFSELEPLIEEAFALYMPQDRYEITEFYQFLVQHYGLTKKSEPYNILEIGTKYGGTFYLWASMNKSSGINISIDMSDGGIHGGISEEEMDKRDLWFYERFDNVHFIRADSHSLQTHADCFRLLERYKTASQVGKIVPTLDFLFIDGDHSYEGVKKDWEMYGPFVKNGGIVAFHDINDSEKHRSRNVYVSKFWKEIVDSGYETIEFNSNLDWAGIGVLIKK